MARTTGVGEAPGVQRPERRFDPDLAEQSFFFQCVSDHGENVTGMAFNRSYSSVFWRLVFLRSSPEPADLLPGGIRKECPKPLPTSLLVARSLPARSQK